MSIDSILGADSGGTASAISKPGVEGDRCETTDSRDDDEGVLLAIESKRLWVGFVERSSAVMSADV